MKPANASSASRIRGRLTVLLFVIIGPAGAVCRGQVAPARVRTSDEQLVSWLRELKPLPKAHYSWPIPDRYLHPLDALLFEYARITHTVSLRGETCTPQQIDAAVSICNRVNQPGPKLPATLAFNYSPWHRRFGKDLPPTDTGPSEVKELRLLRDRFAFIADRIATANRLENANVTVSAILLDCERFYARPGDSAWNDAMTAKYRTTYNVAHQYFPHARIEWYNRGGVSPSAASTGWSQNKHFTLKEPGDSFSCSLYRVPEISTTRETFRKTVALADAAGVDDVTPWVALASGYRRTPTSMSVWSFDWRYDLSYSWLLGAELNNPWFSKPANRARFAPWNRAKVVVFYPEPFGRSPLWGLHFVAYVRGANGVRVLPGDEPARPVTTQPSD